MVLQSTTLSETLSEHRRMWSQTPSSTSQPLPRTKKKSAITRSYQDKKISLRLAPSGTLEKWKWQGPSALRYRGCLCAISCESRIMSETESQGEGSRNGGQGRGRWPGNRREWHGCWEELSNSRPCWHNRFWVLLKHTLFSTKYQISLNNCITLGKVFSVTCARTILIEETTFQKATFSFTCNLGE